MLSALRAPADLGTPGHSMVQAEAIFSIPLLNTAQPHLARLGFESGLENAEDSPLALVLSAWHDSAKGSCGRCPVLFPLKLGTGFLLILVGAG